MRQQIAERILRMRPAIPQHQVEAEIRRHRQLERSRRLSEDDQAMVDQAKMEISLKHTPPSPSKEPKEHEGMEERREAEAEKHPQGKRPKPEERETDQESKKMKLSRRAALVDPRPILHRRGPVSGVDATEVESPRSSSSSETELTETKVSAAQIRLKLVGPIDEMSHAERAERMASIRPYFNMHFFRKPGSEGKEDTRDWRDAGGVPKWLDKQIKKDRRTVRKARMRKIGRAQAESTGRMRVKADRRGGRSRAVPPPDPSGPVMQALVFRRCSTVVARKCGDRLGRAGL